MPYFNQNEQVSFSPVHGLNDVTKKWIADQQATFKRAEVYEDEPGKNLLYKVDDLRDAIEQDISAIGQGIEGNFSNEELVTINSDIVCLYSHGSQYGIDFIFIGED